MNEVENLDNLGTTLALKKRAELASKRVVPNKSEGFIRVKYIKGRPYYYLVKTVREDGKVKQKVLKYLGTRKPREKEGISENKT